MPSAPLSPAAGAAAICHQDAYTQQTSRLKSPTWLISHLELYFYTPLLAMNILLNTSTKYPKTTFCVLFNVLTSAENMAPVYDSASVDKYTTAENGHTLHLSFSSDPSCSANHFHQS